MKTDKDLLFNLLQGLNYRQTLDELMRDLDYTLGDYRFQNANFYQSVRNIVKHLWVDLRSLE